MFSSEREGYRRVMLTAWRKSLDGAPLEPLEAQLVAVLRRHPEYQPLLAEDAGAVDRDFPADRGQTNPFLHLGLHLAIQEQLGIDQPPGIRDLFQALVAKTGDPHLAEHQLMACLEENLWRLSQSAGPFDTADYLACVRRRCGS